MILRHSFFIIVLTLFLTLSLALNVYLFEALQLKQTDLASSFEQQEQRSAAAALKSTTIEPPTISDRAKVDEADSLARMLEQIAALVASEEYYAATALLVELEQDRPLAAKAVKVRWQQSISAMIGANGIEAISYSTAELFLQAYLASYPDDPVFLSLHVDWYLVNQQVELAINQAYDILFHVLEPGQKQVYFNSARSLALNQAEVILQLQAWSALAVMCRQILAMDPDFYQIQLFLAKAEYEQGRLSSAENIVKPLLSDPLFGEQAQALLDDIEYAYRRPIIIPLIRQGQHFIVNGQINNDSDVALLLDTGATISVLSQDAFDQLEYETEFTFVKNIWLNTAGGRVGASIYRVDRFELSGLAVEEMLFAISPNLPEGIDGLLGMNFLKHFDFYIDQTNNILQLEYK